MRTGPVLFVVYCLFANLVSGCQCSSNEQARPEVGVLDDAKAVESLQEAGEGGDALDNGGPEFIDGTEDWAPFEEKAEGMADLAETTPEPILVLELCLPGFVDCLDVDELEPPYIRETGYLRARLLEANEAAGEPSVTLSADGQPLDCVNDETADLCAATLDGQLYDEGVTVVARALQNEQEPLIRKARLAVLNCKLPAGRSLCLNHGGWETKPDVFEYEDGGLQGGHGGFFTRHDANQELVGITLTEVSIDETNPSCQIVGYDRAGDLWSRRVIYDYTTRPNEWIWDNDYECSALKMFGYASSPTTEWFVLRINSGAYVHPRFLILTSTNGAIKESTIDMCMLCPEVDCSRLEGIFAPDRAMDYVQYEDVVHMLTGFRMGDKANGYHLRLDVSAERWSCRRHESETTAFGGVPVTQVVDDRELHVVRHAHDAFNYGVWTDSNWTLSKGYPVAQPCDIAYDKGLLLVGRDRTAHVWTNCREDVPNSLQRSRIRSASLHSQENISSVLFPWCTYENECLLQSDLDGLMYMNPLSIIGAALDACDRDHIIVWTLRGPRLAYISLLNGEAQAELALELDETLTPEGLEWQQVDNGSQELFFDAQGGMHFYYIYRSATSLRLRHAVRPCRSWLE